MPSIPKRLFVSMFLGILICLLVGAAERLGLLLDLELQGYDLLVSRREPLPPLDELVFVDFDDPTVKEVGPPIPRGVLAEALQKISTGEPELIGLDWLLSEKHTAVEDQKLAAVIADAGNVILVNNFGGEHLPPSEPLPEFREHALDTGFANLMLDQDGPIRRMFLQIRTQDFAGVSFPVALATNYLGKPLQHGRAGSYSIGTIEIPLVDRGPDTALIGYWSSKPPQTVSAQRLLNGDFDTKIFKNKIVLVGQSSNAANDVHVTPVFRFRRPGEPHALISGTEIHAAALASLLTGKVIRVLGWRAQWCVNLLLCLLVVALVIRVPPLYSIPAVGVVIVGTYLLAQLAYSEHQVWMKFFSTEAGIILALPAGLGYRFLEERRLKSHAEAERGELMGLFGRYVSPEVAAEIWSRRGEIALAGQEKTATVLFSDIRNFTALTAAKPSAEVLAWLNDYFTAMSAVIKANGGFLNKFIGDGMLVVFGVPLSEGAEKDACRAVQTALEMLEQVEKLNAHQSPGRPQIAIGIGLHTGPLTAGNVGARDRLEYSVIGETVNLASRLEALTKEFKTPIVMTPQTRKLVEHRFETTPLGETAVRGFTEKIQVYTVVEKNSSEARP